MFAIRSLQAILLILILDIAALAQDLTLDQILKKNEDALGGTDALRNIQTLRMVSQADGGARRVLSIKRPDSLRIETSIRGMSLITGLYGRSRWGYNPLDNPALKTSERQPGEGWFESTLASEMFWLAGLKTGGASVELLAKEPVKDSPAYKIKVTPKGDVSTLYYVDAGTFLVVKTFTRIEGKEMFMEIEKFPEDCRKVGGISFAYSILQKTKSDRWGAQSSRDVYEAIAVNEPMEDSLFKMPTAEMLAEMTRGTTLKGKLENITVHGESLVGNLIGDSPDRPVTIYLPPSYEKEPNRRYPVVYMLHGFGINNDQWTRPVLPNNITVPAEKAFSAGAHEMILVVPSAFTSFIGSMYSSSATTGDWESFIAKELVAYIDSHYRTIPERTSRGLAGHSMGGYGTFRIAMKHPEVFSSMYSLSPCCMSPTMKPQLPLMQQIAAMKNLKEIEQSNFAVQAMMASAAAWSPNPKRPPFYLDLPVENGKPRPEIIAQWAANAPITMVHQYIPNLKQYHAIAFDIGDKDIVVAEGEDVMLQASKDMDQILRDYGVDHTFEIYEGDHTNRIAERIEAKVIPFFSNNLTSK